MSLPILKITSAPTTETLIRYFHQTESNWTEDLAEKTVLDFGTAWVNPQLTQIAEANRILDAVLPPGISSAEAVEQADAHFASAGAKCLEWIMNPSAPPEQSAALVEFLVSQRNHQRRAKDIMYLDHLPSSLIAGSTMGLTIIPTRASYKHAAALHHEWADEWKQPQLAESEGLHLDNPHYDASLALRNGTAVAHAGVLAMGEVGRVDQVVVSPAFRGQLIGTTMMSRIMEVCARSLFKHVLLAVEGDNVPAVRLYQKFGFRKIGQIVSYVPDDAASRPPGES